MPKLIERGYDTDKIIALIVSHFSGPVNDGNVTPLADMRAAMEYELRQAVATGDGRRIRALRDALEDMSS